MSFNIKGVDISNNNSISDLSTLKNNGVEYVYLKATEGATFKDSTSINRYNQAKSLGLKVGFYHFLVSTSSPQDQAESFWNYVKDFNCDLKYCLDVEKDWNGMSNATIDFINHWNEISGGKELIIYTYSGFLSNFTQRAIDVIKDMYVWIANYRNDYEGVNIGFFNKVCGWQYSENDSIGNFTGDCNVFNEGCLLNTRDKKYYVVTYYLPQAYSGYDGVDINYVLQYFKGIKCYVRGNAKGVWIETEYLSKQKCEELKQTLGSWFYEIKEE